MIKSKFLPSLVLLFITPLSLAQLSSQDIKGLYNNMPIEYRYLSPIQGFNALKSGQIQSWYHFQKKIKGISDPLFQLTNQLFHAPVKLIKASKISAKLLSPEVIATILMHLPTKQDIDDLEKIIEKKLGPEEKEPKKATIDIPFQSYTLTRIPLPPKPYMEKALIEYAKEIKKKLENSFTKDTTISDVLKNNSSSASLLKNIINYSVDLAIKSITGEYPDYTAHQILLAFLWINTERKKDLKNYFDALQQLHEDRKANLGKKESIDIIFLHDMENVLAESYSENELDEFKSEIVEKAHANAIDNAYLMEHYEKINATFGYLQDVSAPLLSGIVEVVLGKRGFTDCGEATVRNILNIALFQKTKLDIDGFKKILLAEKYITDKDPHGALAQDPFVQFFERYGSLASTFNPSTRSEWSELLANIKGVDYGILFPYKGQEKFACEIKGRAGINNLLLVLEHILFADSFIPPSNLNERIKKIFDTLSVNKKLAAEFKPENTSRGWGDLIILVDKEPSFNVSIEEKHFELLPIKENSNTVDGWWSIISDNLLRSVDEQNKIETLGILGWIHYGIKNIADSIENGYQLISKSNLKNQVSKNNFFAWWLLSFPLDDFRAREAINNALDHIPSLFKDIAKEPAILYYLQLFNPTSSFIQSELKNARIKYLSGIIEYIAPQDPATALMIMEKVLLYLMELGLEKKEELILKKYEKLEWGKDIKNWRSVITEKVSQEKLEDLSKITGEIITNLKNLDASLQKKNKKTPKQIKSMLEAIQTLENHIEKILSEKEKEAVEGVIGELF